tara:strand:- start:2575 stop:2691 length:117 start_codon:yes stop_codon:yes gene_type:complete
MKRIVLDRDALLHPAAIMPVVREPGFSNSKAHEGAQHT